MTHTASLAQWLARHVDAIAQDEAAGEIFNDVKRIVEGIERMINRPIPDQLCGKCPPCDLALYAPRAATEVVCPQCNLTHDIESLFDQALHDGDEMSFTISELHRTILPAVREYVPPRTLQHWAACGKLVPTGYDADGEPRFMLADVRGLRDAKTQVAATGAAAEKYKRKAS